MKSGIVRDHNDFAVAMSVHTLFKSLLVIPFQNDLLGFLVLDNLDQNYDACCNNSGYAKRNQHDLPYVVIVVLLFHVCYLRKKFSTYSIQHFARKIKYFFCLSQFFLHLDKKIFICFTFFASCKKKFEKYQKRCDRTKNICYNIKQFGMKGESVVTYKSICEQLRGAGIENAETEAGLLLEHFCGVRPAELLFRKNEEFDLPALEHAVARRLGREPLQYLLGEWEFFGMSFAVSPDCLIPRADTEILVEKAISLVPHGAHFADFCTGSGCIAAAVLANRPDTKATLVDAFENTLAMAKKNCERHGVDARAQFVLQDLLQPLQGVFEQKFDCILSNPPYIPCEVVKGLAPELAHEPQAALDGGEDGLNFYRHFLAQSRHVLKKGGFWCFEIGYDQADAMHQLAAAHGFSCEIGYDLGGNARTALIRKLD